MFSAREAATSNMKRSTFANELDPGSRTATVRIQDEAFELPPFFFAEKYQAPRHPSSNIINIRISALFLNSSFRSGNSGGHSGVSGTGINCCTETLVVVTVSILFVAIVVVLVSVEAGTEFGILWIVVSSSSFFLHSIKSSHLGLR